jgi:hypothetical protein
MSVARSFGTATAVIALAGCAAFGPRITPPTVIVTDVRLDRVESVDAYFVAGVLLTNPNAQDIAVEALDGRLGVEGETVATAALSAPVRVPAGGTASAEIVAKTGIDAILRAVANAMRRLGATPPGGSPALHYVLEGQLRLANGVQVPLLRSGELGSRPAR